MAGIEVQGGLPVVVKEGIFVCFGDEAGEAGGEESEVCGQ
jgi:hypothetical protein